MFALFKKKNGSDLLDGKCPKIMGEAFILSKSDRKIGNTKFTEANAILNKIEKFNAAL